MSKRGTHSLAPKPARLMLLLLLECWGVCGETGVERRGVANVPRVVGERYDKAEEKGKKREEMALLPFFFLFSTRVDDKRLFV